MALGVITPTTTVGWGSENGMGAQFTLPSVYADAVLHMVIIAKDSSALYVQVSAYRYAYDTNYWQVAWWWKTDLVNWHTSDIVNNLPPGHNLILGARISAIQGGYAWVYEVTDTTTGTSYSNIFVTTAASAVKNEAQEVYAFESYSSNASFFNGQTLTSYPTVRYYDRASAQWVNVIGDDYVMTTGCGRFGIDYTVGTGATVPSWWLETGSDQDSSLAAGKLVEGYNLVNGVNTCTSSRSPRLWGPHP